MLRYYRSEGLSPQVIQGLRWRFQIRRGYVLLLLATLALVGLGAAIGGSTGKTFFVAAMSTFLIAMFFALQLLWGECPRCNQRFSPPSFINLFVYPWPSCFASECARCGVPLSVARH